MGKIGDEKNIENALFEAENRYRLLVQHMTDGLGVRDENGIITYSNPRICEMLGYSPDEFSGRKITEFVDRKNRTQLNKQLAKRKTGRVGTYELDFIKKDGSRVSTLISPQTLYDTKGRFKGSLAFITSITERKPLEATGRQEKKLLECDNASLKLLLKNQEKSRKDFYKAIRQDLDESVIPYLEEIKKCRIDKKGKILLKIIESGLKSISDPPLQEDMPANHIDFTPREILVADLIKQGKSSKKIAETLMVSQKTIDIHRHNIRKKAGIINKDINLITYLQSL